MHHIEPGARNCEVPFCRAPATYGFDEPMPGNSVREAAFCHQHRERGSILESGDPVLQWVEKHMRGPLDLTRQRTIRNTRTYLYEGTCPICGKRVHELHPNVWRHQDRTPACFQSDAPLEAF